MPWLIRGLVTLGKWTLAGVAADAVVDKIDSTTEGIEDARQKAGLLAAGISATAVIGLLLLISRGDR